MSEFEFIVLLILALFSGGIITFLVMKANRIPLKTHEALKRQLAVTENDLNNTKSSNNTLQNRIAAVQAQNTSQQSQLSALNTKMELLQDMLSQKETQTQQFQGEIENKNDKIIHLNNLLSKNQAHFAALKERIEKQQQDFDKLSKKSLSEFENIASKLLEEKAKTFESKSEENIGKLLTPLREKIKEFSDKVEKSQMESVKRHSALDKQLEDLRTLNQRLSEDATNLTKALKGDSKMQGNWGELVLERVLEKSGLTKDREYFVQQSVTNEDGRRLIPDVVLHLPDNKKMIIDAKVSLKAYSYFVNEDDDYKRATHIKMHIASLEKHIDQLSKKNYQQLYDIQSPDFVLMFIPIETAFAAAANQKPELYGKAFDKNIIIVTPSTLLATLRVVDSMWKNDRQQRNAIEIATKAGRLYDQFVALTGEIEKMGKNLQTIQKTYNRTLVKLTGKGNLLKKVSDLKILGAKASKNLSPTMRQMALEEE